MEFLAEETVEDGLEGGGDETDDMAAYVEGSPNTVRWSKEEKKERKKKEREEYYSLYY